MRKWSFMAVLLSLVFGGWHLAPAEAGVISASEVQEKLAAEEQITIIDVREPQEHAQGTIPGALRIPLRELESSDLLETLSDDDWIVVVCRSGNRSATAQMILKANGFTNVQNLTGGMLGWQGDLEFD